MRGWPETFPQPHIKAGGQLLSHKRLPAHSGPGGGRGSRGTTLSTWPPQARLASPGAAPAHCPPRAREAPTAGRSEAVFYSHLASHLPCPHRPGAGSVPGPITHPGLLGEGSLGDTSHSRCYADPAACPLPATHPGLASPPQAHSSAPKPAWPVLCSPSFTSMIPTPSPPCTQVTAGEHGRGLLPGPQLPGLGCRTALPLPWAGGGRDPQGQLSENARCWGSRASGGRAGGCPLQLTDQSTSLMMTL